MTEDELSKILNNGEDAELECKLAQGGLPKSLWTSYSAFANTNGGIILLGVEEVNGAFIPRNVDVVTLQKVFWDTINDKQKVSGNILQNDNVMPIDIGDMSILKITVPSATRQQRPVYVGVNPYTGTFRRNYEGDYRCRKDEINGMIAEQSDFTRDSHVLEEYGLDDLNKESLRGYRQRFSNNNIDSDWNALNDTSFLKRIGGWGVNRNTKREGLTVAGLLMFGEDMTIMSYLPTYFLDYREKLSNIPGQRWSDRITSQDGNWSGNLFDFYFKVIKKVNADVKVPFVLEGDELARQMDTRVHKALREAVLNTLIHADYFAGSNVVIEKELNFYRFSNPGLMRIPLEQAIEGGVSDARNRQLFKMFALIGLGERSGYGLENIHTTWKEQHWRRPALVQEYSPDKTILTLLPVSLLPDEVVDFLRRTLQDRFHILSADEVLALVTAYEEKSVTNTRMQELTSKHSQEMQKILANLVREGLLVTVGQGRGTNYILSDLFLELETGVDKKILHNNGGMIRNTDEMISNNDGMIRNTDEMISNNGGMIRNTDEMISNNGGMIRNTDEMISDSSEGSEDNRYELYQNLQEIAQPAREKSRLNPEVIRSLILLLCDQQFLSLVELSELLNRQPDGLRRHHINRLVEANKLELRYPNVIRHKNQAYKTAERL